MKTKLKIIKITKSIISRDIIGYMVLFDDEDFYNEDEVKIEVEDWCEREGSGSTYGYRYTWENVTDKEKITELLKDELKEIKDLIKYYKNKKSILIEYINQNNS